MKKIIEFMCVVFEGIVEGRARRAQLNLNYRSRSWE
jgi:hypothetical protein